MELYLLRHAQSTNNHLWDQQQNSNGRVEDPDLTRLGMKQAGRLGKHVKKLIQDRKLRIDQCHLYSSLMLRAVRTGTEVSKATGIPLKGWLDWHEVGGIYLRNGENGEKIGLAGKDRAFFEREFPNFILPEGINERGWWNRPHEEAAKSSERARAVLEELIQRHGKTEDLVFVVMHGDFFNRFMNALLDMPEETPIWFGMNNAAITHIMFRESEYSIHCMNRHDYLPKAWLS